MRKLVFDTSIHFGQFNEDQGIRNGCKYSQESIAGLNENGLEGLWTDLENGRADKTIWNLPRDLQDEFYPFMDRFFSVKKIEQNPLSKEVENIALDLRGQMPSLSLYSRYTCALAIAESATEIHTLFTELLTDVVRINMDTQYDIAIETPYSFEEHAYTNPALETTYQTALKAFKTFGIDPLKHLADNRTVIGSQS